MKVIMLRSNIGQMRRKIRFQTYQCAYIHDKSKKEDKIMTSEHKNRAKTCKSDRDIEEEWNQLRRKTLKIPHKIPRAVNEVMKNTMRMRRLGLADIDDEHKVNLDLNIKEKYKKNDLDDSLKSNYPGNGRSSKTLRNPMSAKDKQFTNASTAPSHVRERQFLIPDEPDNAKALDVAVIGRPNAGKSSIMNFLLGANVSAVSAKYNTTRDRVLGIYTSGNTQISFYDTPGLIKPKETHEYVRSLVTTASETLEGVDLSMLVVDAVKRLDEHALNALEKVLTTSAQVSSPIMLVMNKYDLVGTKQEEKSLTHKVHDLTEMITDIYKNNYNNEEASVGIDPLQYTGENTLYVSALKGKGMKKLRATLKSLALERSWSYHSSLISDRSDLELVTEIIREKLFRRFNKELPYAFEQENIGWTEFKDKSLRIDQDIFVAAPRVRKMVVGHNGDTIRSVGITAREDISQLLGRPVHLYLNVRVRNSTK